MEHDLLIIKEGLKNFINQMYNIDVKEISFITRGLRSYSYVVLDKTGKKYYLKLFPFHDINFEKKIDNMRKIINLIKEDYIDILISSIVFTHNGLCSIHFGEFTMTIYEFVEGETLGDTYITDVELDWISDFISYLHSIKVDEAKIELQREMFLVPYKSEILQLIKPVEVENMNEYEYIQKISHTISQHKPTLNYIFSEIDKIRNNIVLSEKRLVVCHSDLTPNNIMRTKKGSLSILNWEDIMLSLPESDFICFTNLKFMPEKEMNIYSESQIKKLMGNYFKKIQTNYLSLDIKLFKFYLYKLWLKNIYFNAMKILNNSISKCMKDSYYSKLVNDLNYINDIEKDILEISRCFS